MDFISENVFISIYAIETILLIVVAIILWRLLEDKKRYESYMALLENSADAIGNGLVFFDQDDHFLKGNKQAQLFMPDLFNGEKKAKTLSDFLNHMYDNAVDYDVTLINALGRWVQRVSASGFREVVKTADGRLCLVEAQKMETGGTILLLVDADEMHKQEESIMRLSHDNYQLGEAVEAATNGIIILRPASGAYSIAFVNKAYLELSGADKASIVGHDVGVLLKLIHDKKAVKHIEGILSGNKPGFTEFNIKPAQGRARWFDMSLTPTMSEGAVQPDLFIGIITEKTDLKAREEEMYQRQKLEALGQLSAGVAHDFNNVLSIIDGYATLAARDLAEGSDQASYVEKIKTASQRGAGLIKQMLTFSRHEIVSDTVIDLGETVREQETLLAPLLNASVKLNLLTDNTDMYIECAQENITQILMNLVVNARDAMPSGGRLLIEARLCPNSALPPAIRKEEGEREFACLSVSDDGMGMDKETVSKIFDPFYTTKKQGKGTGLGLSMVYGLVQQAGGYVDVQSVLGQGTMMSIYWPISDKKPTRIVQETDDIEAIRFEGYTVLIAEDEPDLLELVGNMMSDLGMNVLKAKNGHEALCVQDEYEGDIHVLLTDIVMPEYGGVELAALVQDLRPEMRVVFMSGYPAGKDNLDNPIPDNAPFMPKPIEYQNLIHVLYDLLEGSAGDRASKGGARWKGKNANA